MSDPYRRIWIVQCLCPSRHCILAILFDPAELAPEAAVERLRDDATRAVASGRLDPWCGLCLSRDWRYEPAPTRFRTIAEAEPEYLKLAIEQAAARRLFERLRRMEG